MSNHDKPFIYIFESPAGYFFYEVNKNQVIEVDSLMYNALNEIQSKGLDLYMRNAEEEVKRQIICLLENGYLSNKHAEIIEHPLTNYCEDYLSYNLNNLILQVTQKCNMRCRYCNFSGDGSLARQHSNLVMTWETAKKTIDFFYEHSKDSEEITISFYGGEPLLEFELIKKCVIYSNRKMFDKKIQFDITTNGTILNTEIINFLEKYDFKLTFSIDGPKEVHNINRRFAKNGEGSFEKIYLNLKNFKEYNPIYFRKIKINAVIEPDRDLNEIEQFFFTDELFRQITVFINKVSDNFIDMNYVETKEYICENETILLKAMLSKIIDKEQHFFNHRIDSLSLLDQDIVPLQDMPKKIHHQGPCLPGYHKLFVDIKGQLRPCEKANELSNHMIIGNIIEGFDYSNIKKLINIGQLTKEECINCWIIRQCSICPVVIDNIDKLSYKQKRRECMYQIAMVKERLLDYVVFKKMLII